MNAQMRYVTQATMTYNMNEIRNTINEGLITPYHSFSIWIKQNERTVKKRKLEEMQNHKQWKECIEMDVKAVAPLHVLTTRWLDNQVSIHHQPSHDHNKYNYSLQIWKWMYHVYAVCAV